LTNIAFPSFHVQMLSVIPLMRVLSPHAIVEFARAYLNPEALQISHRKDSTIFEDTKTKARSTVAMAAIHNQ
jgi:hypothetical protein